MSIHIIGTLPGFFQFFNDSSMMRFTLSHRSTDTMASHSVLPHSSSGFSVPDRLMAHDHEPMLLDYRHLKNS